MLEDGVIIDPIQVDLLLQVAFFRGVVMIVTT
jgi:hypothetical protein